MIKQTPSIIFICPGCHVRFEFDAVGANEFVPCPVCGTEYFTIKRGNGIILEYFDSDQMFEAPILA